MTLLRLMLNEQKGSVYCKELSNKKIKTMQATGENLVL
jgi:hypothetical protein